MQNTDMNGQSTQTMNLIKRLQDMIHERLQPFVDGQPITIVDFPDIRNVGDSAIWSGEIAYLADRYGVAPAYVTKMKVNRATLDRVAPGGPIFIHGGGNFGDIWPGHQNFRETVLRDFRDRKIIQFPQSIHFGDPTRIDQAARLIDEHGNFVLFVRDEESLEFSRKHFNCESYLCPDMAPCIGQTARVGEPKYPILAMLRQDKEGVGNASSNVLGAIPIEDWITESRFDIRRVKTLAAIRAASFNTEQTRFAVYDAAANARFQRGIRQLSQGRVIITDRLHVHIISLLLGLPHAVLDNSYGKIARFMTAFGTDTDLVYRATSLTGAVEWAKARAAQ